MGSCMPYNLLNPSIFSACCVASQFFKRDSRGWLLFSSVAVEWRPERIVSRTAGFDGAPAAAEVGVIFVGCVEAGTTRRDFCVFEGFH